LGSIGGCGGGLVAENGPGPVPTSLTGIRGGLLCCCQFLSSTRPGMSLSIQRGKHMSLLLWITLCAQGVIFATNVWLLSRVARNNNEGRAQVAWMDEQIKAAERENEVLGNLVALYLAFHYKGLYW
jgi:hypothetical protein